MNRSNRKSFYRRMISRMIAYRLQKTVYRTTCENIMTSRREFCWRNPTKGNDDLYGPTIIFILLRKVKINTVCDEIILKNNLHNKRSQDFNNNVSKILDHMTSKYDQIVNNGKVHLDYLHDLLDALYSVENISFQLFLKPFQHKCHSNRTSVSHYSLITEDIIQYNNLIERGKWNTHGNPSSFSQFLETESEHKFITISNDSNLELKLLENKVTVKTWRLVKTS